MVIQERYQRNLYIAKNSIKRPSKAMITAETTGQLAKRTNVNRSKKFKAGISTKRYVGNVGEGAVQSRATSTTRKSVKAALTGEGSVFGTCVYKVLLLFVDWYSLKTPVRETGQGLLKLGALFCLDADVIA
jgi:hypothetical protein